MRKEWEAAVKYNVKVLVLYDQNYIETTKPWQGVETRKSLAYSAEIIQNRVNDIIDAIPH
jgi:hypothetical protein